MVIFFFIQIVCHLHKKRTQDKKQLQTKQLRSAEFTLTCDINLCNELFQRKMNVKSFFSARNVQIYIFFFVTASVSESSFSLKNVLQFVWVEFKFKCKPANCREWLVNFKIFIFISCQFTETNLVFMADVIEIFHTNRHNNQDQNIMPILERIKNKIKTAITFSHHR